MFVYQYIHHENMSSGSTDKKNNILPVWGNEKTMNLNNLILTNILSSHYFKVNLYQLKTYHEVVDEIYYNVNHLEPWEKGSRKTAGQTGMCGGVRGVGAGGIVSTAFCILYKLFTLKLTRKQLNGLLIHCDSPYIRGLGFMYIRYTQPPADLWDWFEPYLEDKEEIDVKAGGGQVMAIGEVVRHMLSKLEWFTTLFPRIPVPIQKDIEKKLSTVKPLSHVPAFSSVTTETNQEDGWQQTRSNQSFTDDNPRRKENDCKTTKEQFRDPVDFADELAKEKERQKKEKDKHSHSKEVSHHRSRSPHRTHKSSKHHHDDEKDWREERDRPRHREQHRSRDRARRSGDRASEHRLSRERDVVRHKYSRDRDSDRHSSREHRSSRDRDRNYGKEKGSSHRHR
ncbi:pre-mRNA-splicing factor 38B-like isoform X2 [Tachypleus tridentatus]|uniref:pre-mRNA-splicing factor 38B-like isoform X2 n=1 Tax=Tachypleus tridentatus TaxID=6853 RepID=UPI003FD13B3A